MEPEARSGQSEARSGRMAAVQAHPLAELLACPQGTWSLLDDAARCIDVDVGEKVFRQAEACRGLYLVVSGQFLRRTEQRGTRLNLGVARSGDLVELAAALGVGHHTYTLTAQTGGSVLMLPMEAVNVAFENYPRLRMQLLEELAREVSRAYGQLPKLDAKVVASSL
jgi:CRP-like cAMP-binding protein